MKKKERISQEALNGVFYLAVSVTVAFAFIVLMQFYEWKNGAGFIDSWLNGV